MSPDILQAPVSFTPDQEQVNDDCQMLVSVDGNGRAGARAQIDGNRVVCRMTPVVEEMFSRRGIRFSRVDAKGIDPAVVSKLELQDGSYAASVDVATLSRFVNMDVLEPAFNAIRAANPASQDAYVLNEHDQMLIVRLAGFCQRAN